MDTTPGGRTRMMMIVYIMVGSLEFRALPK